MDADKYDLGFWLTVLIAFGIIDYILAEDETGSSFSETNRVVIRAIPGGKWVFRAVWTCFASWYLVHIERKL